MAAATASAAMLAGCGSSASAGGSAALDGAGAISVPMATSYQSSGGPWAVAAMGDLSQPLNTFWQLFHQAASGGAWSDDVEVTATATNGGLVVAGEGNDVVVGVVPSQNLTFTPLVLSHDSGRTFPVNGLVPGGLDPTPDSLAESPGGRILALVDGSAGSGSTASSGSEVLEGDATLDHWPVLAGQESLARSSVTAPCRVSALDAVAFDGEQPVVGATCGAPGVVGLYRYSGTGWVLDSPQLPRALAADTVKVLAVRQNGATLAALLGVRGPSGAGVLAAWGTDLKGAPQWQTSPVLPLASPAAIASIGAAGPGGWFVIQSPQSGPPTGSVMAPTADAWRSLATLPADTDTLVFGPDGQTAQALSGTQTVLGVWRLGSGAWVRSQTLPVEISFGSSG